MTAVEGTLLLVDDEPAVFRALRPSLYHAGFHLTEARSGEEALGYLRTTPFDAVLLDMLLPGLDGIGVCRIVRRDFPRLPIVMLTALISEDHVVDALDAGADDYVVKPFGIRELLARIRSLVRRSRLKEDDEEQTLSFGAIALDPSSHTVRKNGRPVHLTPKEFELLRQLMLHAGKTVSHAKLLQSVWGPTFGEEHEYLRTFVRKLRIKLEDNPADPRYLVSDIACGYRFDAADFD